jgi:hypothetical protein
MEKKPVSLTPFFFRPELFDGTTEPEMQVGGAFVLYVCFSMAIWEARSRLHEKNTRLAVSL